MSSKIAQGRSTCLSTGLLVAVNQIEMSNKNEIAFYSEEQNKL